MRITCVKKQIAMGRTHVKFYIRSIRFFPPTTTYALNKNNVVTAAVCISEGPQTLGPARNTAAAKTRWEVLANQSIN